MTALEAIRVILASDDARRAALSIQEQLKADKKRSRSARKAKAKSLSLPGKTKAERRKDKRERTSEVRKACVERSGGCCERCGASAGEALHMDHFWGRAREESVESCWMLCPRCDRLKTDNHTSRIHWLMEFQQHCARKDYETQAQKVRVHLRLEYAQHPERRSTEP